MKSTYNVPPCISARISAVLAARKPTLARTFAPSPGINSSGTVAFQARYFGATNSGVFIGNGTGGVTTVAEVKRVLSGAGIPVRSIEASSPNP